MLTTQSSGAVALGVRRLPIIKSTTAAIHRALAFALATVPWVNEG